MAAGCLDNTNGHRGVGKTTKLPLTIDSSLINNIATLKLERSSAEAKGQIGS